MITISLPRLFRRLQIVCCQNWQARVVLLHEFKLGRTAAEETQIVINAWAEDTTSESSVRRCFEIFGARDFSLEVRDRRGLLASGL